MKRTSLLTLGKHITHFCTTTFAAVIQKLSSLKIGSAAALQSILGEIKETGDKKTKIEKKSFFNTGCPTYAGNFSPSSFDGCLFVSQCSPTEKTANQAEDVAQ